MLFSFNYNSKDVFVWFFKGVEIFFFLCFKLVVVFVYIVLIIIFLVLRVLFLKLGNWKLFICILFLVNVFVLLE